MTYYYRGLVDEFVKDYIAYIDGNWEKHIEKDTTVMSKRRYIDLKKQGFEYSLSRHPIAKKHHLAWTAVRRKWGREANDHVKSTSQETGRQITLHAARAIGKLLRQDGRKVLNPNGTVMGRMGRGRGKKFNPETPTPEVANEKVSDKLIKAKKEGNFSIHKWRVMSCANKTGGLPSVPALSALLGITASDTEDMIKWLRRTHVVTVLRSGTHKTEPKKVNIEKLAHLAEKVDSGEATLEEKKVMELADMIFSG